MILVVFKNKNKKKKDQNARYSFEKNILLEASINQPDGRH